MNKWVIGGGMNLTHRIGKKKKEEKMKKIEEGGGMSALFS